MKLLWSGTLVSLVLSALVLLDSGGSPVAPARAEGPTATGPATLFGAAVQEQGDQNYVQARRAAERRYGRLPVVRYFDPNLPNDWSILRHAVGKRKLVVSFRIDPVQVVSGQYDDLLLQWFRDAPKGRLTWWSWNPEPEDHIERGEWTAAQYRAAYRHISRLEGRADNPKLRSTLALMCWTLDPLSGRSWRDYFAGAKHVDVLAWDCYNYDAAKGGYTPPRVIFGRAYRLAVRRDMPWGIAETGSTLAVGDDGRKRATWLHRLRRYAQERDARFVTYFDVRMEGADFRLRDARSKAAWRRAVSGRN